MVACMCGVCFFKQKTAYEMRISDWSSDVCSSDLLQDGMAVQIESYEEEPLAVVLPETVVMEVVEADAVVKGQTASSSYKPAVLENGEIGRASCRERVCQYV